MSVKEKQLDSAIKTPRTRSERRVADRPMSKEADPGGVSGKGTGKEGYKVGYRKPPLHTRFKPGQSGNPAGRARGTPNIKTLIEQIGNTRVKAKRNGKTRSLPVIDAIIHQMTAQSASGDLKAARLFFDTAMRSGAFSEKAPSEERATEALLPAEMQILSVLQNLLDNRTPPKATSDD